MEIAANLLAGPITAMATYMRARLQADPRSSIPKDFRQHSSKELTEVMCTSPLRTTPSESETQNFLAQHSHKQPCRTSASTL